jgi:uncharacterized UPF0160 family protein
MIEQKEAQLETYYELTKKLLDSFLQGKEDEITSLLDSREECISEINKLDDEAGRILTNNRIQECLSQLMEIEKDIQKHMKLSLQRLANQVKFAQNEQYLSKQYEEQIPVSKGIFYDKSK